MNASQRSRRNTFAAPELDRVAERRSDAAWLAALERSPAARFLMLVEERARSPLSAAECAARLAVSADHLHATVRRVPGSSVGEVIRDRRLLEAKRLLRYSDLPVATIAAELDFEDPAYFSRFFKRYAHQTPLQFRGQP